MRIFHRIALFGLALLFLAAPAQAQSEELPLGSALPMADASVTLVDGSSRTMASLAGATGTVFIFWSNQCPWVDKYRARIDALHAAFSGNGIRFVAVNANDASAFPQEAPAEGVRQGLPFDYFIDDGAAFALAVGASRQPHVFAFDANKALVYVGSIDDSPGDEANVQNRYLHDALTALTANAASPTIGVAKTKAFGCTIKFPGG